MCPGYNLAIIAAIALLVNILKIFWVKLVEGQMVTPKFGIGQNLDHSGEKMKQIDYMICVSLRKTLDIP